MSFFSTAFNCPTDLQKQKKHIRRFSTALIAACGLLLSGAAFAQADMDLTGITVSPTSAPANSTFTATFNIANASLSDPANDAQLVGNITGIPAGGSATLVSVTPSSGSCSASGAQFTCNFGTLNASATRTVTAVYQLNNAVGTWTVAGTVSTTSADGNPGNDTANATATTTFGVDLGISGGPTSPPSPIGGGIPFSYPLEVANNGPFDLTAGQQIVVQFTVPDRVHMSGWRSTTWDEWICSPRTADAGTQVTCVFDKGLANGAVKELDILAVGMQATGSAVDAVFGVNAQQNNGTPIPDTVTTNDTQTIGVEFIASTDVSIAKTAVIDSGPGQVVFTLTPQLRGGDPARWRADHRHGYLYPDRTELGQHHAGRRLDLRTAGSRDLSLHGDHLHASRIHRQQLYQHAANRHSHDAARRRTECHQHRIHLAHRQRRSRPEQQHQRRDG